MTRHHERAPFQVLVLPYRQEVDGTYKYALFFRKDEGYWQGVAGGGWKDTLMRGEDVQSVDMHVFGRVGTVTLRCWLCHACRPTAATVRTTSGLLADRVLGWYRANPSVWPALQSSANG